MVFLQPSSSESAFVFSTDDGSDAIVLDIKGVYALLDGGTEPLNFLHCLRTPTAAIVSTASPSALTNAIELNKESDSLVAVVGNIPTPAALKDAAAAEPIRELYKALSVPPVVTHLKGAKPEPIVVHKGLSSGTLSVYTLAGDAKDAEAVAKAYQSGSADAIEAAAAAGSSVLLIVWEPARSDAPIKRILHLGSAPLPRIQQALDRARSLPFLQSATPSAASLKSKPAASAAAKPASSSRPAARVAPSAAAASAAKPAARVAPAARPAARPTSSTRAAPATAAAAKPSSARASVPTRAVAPAAARPSGGSAASPATRPARAAVPSRPAAVPAARTSTRPSHAAAAKEEVAKKTIIGKSAAAPSSGRSSTSTPNGPASRTPSKAAAPSPVSAAASPAAAAAVAATAVAAVAASAAAVASPTMTDPSPSVSPAVQHEEAAAPTAVTAPSISVSIEEPSGDDGVTSTPGGLPVPASPTIIPATPQPPMSPEPEEEKEPIRESSPEPTPAVVPAADAATEHDENEQPKEEEKEQQPAAPAADEKEEEEPSTVPTAPLEPTASVDEPECMKELVDEEPEPKEIKPTPTPTPTPADPTEQEEEDQSHDEPQPVPPVEPEEEPTVVPEAEPVVVPTPVPVDPPVGDLLGDFDAPAQPQQPGDDGLLDSLEEPMKKMKISMDTDKLAEELGLGVGEVKTGVEGENSLLDLTQESLLDFDLDKTQNTSVIESAHEFDGHLSPTREEESAEELQRKLSTQAEENLLATAAAPFIAGLVSTVVESATIDGAKSTIESLMNNSKGVESPTGDKLLSFRSTGYENPDEPKEVKYEESDPAIDDVLTKLADESDIVNGGNHHVELNGHGDGHHIVNGNGWPEGTTMHLPPPIKGGPKENKFKLGGPVHVDLVTVPHRGKHILLEDEAASIEFFSSVRSSIYILQSGGDVPLHVLEGWKKGKNAWAVNVHSRLVPTHHNDSIAKWASENFDELAEVGLAVATPVDLTTLTYPDGQAKACTLVL